MIVEDNLLFELFFSVQLRLSFIPGSIVEFLLLELIFFLIDSVVTLDLVNHLSLILVLLIFELMRWVLAIPVMLIKDAAFL